MRSLSRALSALLVLLCLPAFAFAQGQWVQQGPPGAPVNTVVVHPTNPSIVYIGLLGRGVYRSENGGKTWMAVNTGLTDLNVGQLVISPSAPATLFAVTELGIFRTIDGGISWSAAANVVLGGSLVIHPENPSTLYLYGGRGIYRTLDAGQNWALATTGLTDGDHERIQCMAIDPVTPTTVYACGRGRFFRSTDGGDHWDRIDVSGFFRGQTMVVDPVTPTTLYHASLEVTFGGVHRSLDGGVTWTPLLATPVSSVALDPITPSTIYACTHFGGIYKTTDGGTVWNSANAGLMPVGCGVLVVHPLVPTTVYATAGDGLVRSDNAAASWSAAVGGLAFRHIAGLVADPVIPSTVYALTPALMRSRDMGATWTTLTSFGLSEVAVHPVNPSIMYGATGSSVLRTLDAGANWTGLITGIPFSATVLALAIDPLTPSTVYAGTSAGVYRSTNGGDSWTLANAGLPGSGQTPEGFAVDWLTIDPQTPSTLFAWGAWQGVQALFRTRDGGESWTELHAGLPSDVQVRALAIDPVNPSILYAGSHAHGVYRTTNGGDTWVAANAGLPPNPVTSLVIDPASPATIYAAAFRYFKPSDGMVGEPGGEQPGAGVFRTTNSGATWSPMNAGLTDLSVKLAIEPRSPAVLYAGTESSSIFRWQPDGIRRLAVTNPGSGSGTVTSVPAGIACGEDCLQEYPTGTVVTLSQTAIAPSTFVSFGGDADCLDGVVTLSDNRTCTATFNLPAHLLTVTRTGAGTGTVSSAPPGITCGADCEESYWLGTVVTLTAAAASGSVFAGWAGACTGTAPTCQLTMAQARSVSATFNPAAPGPVFKLVPANHSALLSPSGAVLNWLAAVRADSYETCHDTTDNNLCDGTWTTVNATNRPILGLSSATTYYWQVRARNITGTTDADGGVWWSFTTGPPTAVLTLDKTSLRFGATTNGTAFVSQTAAQVVRLTQTGTVTVTWTATSNQPWLQVSPASGTGSATLSVSVVSVGGLPLGSTVTGAITVTLTGASNTAGPIAVTLNLIPNGTSASPFGFVDTPLDNTTGVTGAIPFTGWALDDVEVTQVTVCRSAFGTEVAPVDPNCGGAAQIFVGTAVFIDGARPDVAAAYPTFPVSTRAGWGFMVLTNMLPNRGNGTYVFHMYARDRENRVTLLGARTMSCANASATKPFGAIDTPTQGGSASGSSFVNFGWALTPLPKTIPIDGSTIAVQVDGVTVGAATYNNFRSDIATLFPGLNNTNGAVGFRIFDTTTLTNGLHTIQWVVSDNQGALDGIGSRFFTVSNGAGAPLMHEASNASRTLDAAGGDAIDVAPLTGEALVGRRGWDVAAPLRAFAPSPSGRTLVRSEEVNRVEFQLGPGWDAGYLRTSDGLAPLPIGSHLDMTAGVFTWAPGVGFVGAYDLVFVQHREAQAVARREVRVLLAPKGSGRVGPQVVIDTPRSQQDVGQPFGLGGWAADLNAASGTGIATVHAWAYPLTGGPPVFLGATSYGGSRPDVAAVHGEQFVASAFGLHIQGLTPGNYDLAVFAWSTERADFVPARTVRVTVRP